jgi:Family of unknown function (DUF6188)
MKGLPSNVDLAPLSGTEVIQICFGATQLQIHFANQSSIFVESEVVFVNADGEVRIEDYSQAASLLCRILGDRTLAATRREDGGLLMTFAGGITLQVLNDSARFESFQVRVAGHTYVA